MRERRPNNTGPGSAHGGAAAVAARGGGGTPMGCHRPAAPRRAATHNASSYAPRENCFKFQLAPSSAMAKHRRLLFRRFDSLSLGMSCSHKFTGRHPRIITNSRNNGVSLWTAHRLSGYLFEDRYSFDSHAGGGWGGTSQGGCDR